MGLTRNARSNAAPLPACRSPLPGLAASSRSPPSDPRQSRHHGSRVIRWATIASARHVGTVQPPRVGEVMFGQNWRDLPRPSPSFSVSFSNPSSNACHPCDTFYVCTSSSHLWSTDGRADIRRTREKFVIIVEPLNSVDFRSRARRPSRESDGVKNLFT